MLLAGNADRPDAATLRGRELGEAGDDAIDPPLRLLLAGAIVVADQLHRPGDRGHHLAQRRVIGQQLDALGADIQPCIQTHCFTS